MNKFISDEEFAEISARIDISLDDIELSSTGELEKIDEESLIIEQTEPDPVDKSILNFESWKKFLEIRESADKEQSLLQEQFSESLKDLRKETNDKEVVVQVELEEIPEDPQEEIQILNDADEKEMSVLGASEEVQPVEGLGFEINPVNEGQLMAEEDFLSGLLENWQKKEKILVAEQERKEENRVLEKIEEKKQRQKRIEKAEELGIKYRIEKKEKLEKEKMEKIMKDREEAQERDEVLLMTAQDHFSALFRTHLKLLQEQKNALREQHFMTQQDQFSLLYRNLVPHKSKRKYITEYSSYQQTNPLVSLTFPSDLIFPKYLKPQPKSQDSLLKTIQLPVPISVPKIQDLKDESDLQLPTLGTCLPYPLDSKSISLEVKHEGIRSISGLSFFNNLQILTLSLNKLEKIQNLPGSLMYLDLSQNLISAIPELNLPLLQELVMDLNQISMIKGLQKCRNLRTLSLNNNKILKIEGLERCGLIDKLLVYRNKIKEIPKGTFANNPYLTHLDLGRNKLQSVYFSEGLYLLKSLILYQNTITEVQSLTLPILQELWLNGNSLKSLDFLKSCPLLENFRLEDNAISTVSPFECPILRNFNISFNNLSKFADIINCIQYNRSLIYFSFNDNPIVLIHPELLPMFNEIVVKALPYIQELNNTPRTSLAKTSLNKAGLSAKAFELHQIDVFSQKVKRKNEIVQYVSAQMKDLLLEIPCRVHNLGAKETQVSTKGFEFFWYNARAALHKHTLAARVVQVWWKYRLLKRRLLLKKFVKHSNLIVKIQKVFRGWRTRKNVMKAKFDPKKIVKIQAAFRGFSLRNRLKRALEGVRTDDLSIDEYKEVNLDDMDLNYDFNNELVIPKNLDLTKFFAPISVAEESKTPKLPPLKAPGKVQNVRPESNRSLQSSTQSSLPPLVKNKVREEMERHIDEWGFCNEGVKEALQYRIMKKMQRKNMNKKTTADERLEKFRRSVKK